MTAAGREAALSVGLFLATLATVTLFSMHGVLGAGEDWSAALASPARWRDALAFSVPLMAILLAHEMAHYVVARRHGFRLSLPRFIPLPFAFGTMGAVIRLKSLP